MFLKCLDISGFKSFADRTRLEFHPGVTGIVGPNGCGKSNVVDAIRWVLGETSAKALRGGEMADVIFNGTDKRKQLGMAEVILTLGDCEESLNVEFNEVSVGRRVYRDGKSEYLLNRKPCRLKDINDLFMDTGIGRSSYSVMEQGKIDMLLSSKPEDRRQVFEEAAGITKFKQQKREALRKLDYTEANLVRITDVIEEQRRQMGSLQRQAAKARRYSNLLDQVKVLDTHYSHRQFQTLNAEREELLNSIESLRQSQSEFMRKIEQGQTRLNETRTAFQNIEQEIGEVRQRENEQQNRIHGATNKIEFNDERRSELETLIERNQADIAATEEKLNSQQDDLFHTDESLKAISEQIAKQDEEVAQYAAQTEEVRRERNEVGTNLQENRNALNASKSLVATLSAQLESGKSQLDSSSKRLEQVNDELKRVGKEEKGKKQEEKSLSKKREEHESTRLSLESELKEVEERFLVAQRDLAATREEEAKLSRELTEKQTRLETLKQLVASGEGFEEGTKEVLKGLDQPDFFGNAVRGTVANFIEVEDELIPAVEAALGHYLQAVIVADATMAQAMIDSLRKGELGQASLIPEDYLKSSADRQLMTVPEGAVGWAIDKVTAEARVQPVVHGLLADVLIVTNLSRAMELRADLPAVGFATLEGEFLSADGVLTGGFKKGGAASVLERQGEIRKLGTRVRNLKKKLAEQEKTREELEAQVLTSREEVETHREKLQQLRVQLSTVDGQLALVQRELQQMESKVESLTWEKDELSKRQSSSREKLAELEERKNEATESIQTLTNAGAELESKLQLVQEKETQANNLLNELRTALAVEKRAEEALREQRAPMASRLEELKEIIKRRKGEIENYGERIKGAAEESEKLRGEIAEAKEVIKGLAEQRQQFEGRRGEYLGVLEQGEAELVRMRQEVTRLGEQRGREEVRSTQLELRLENVTGMITQRYQIDLETFRPDSHALLGAIEEQRKAYDRNAKRRASMEGDDSEPAEEVSADAEQEEAEVPDDSQPDWDFVESIMAGLKQKLDSMGPVNIDAIAEYEELEERFNLMQEQHDDLVSSKEELLKVIQKINRTTKVMFQETFEKVTENFRGMFTELSRQRRPGEPGSARRRRSVGERDRDHR